MKQEIPDKTAVLIGDACSKLVNGWGRSGWYIISLCFISFIWAPIWPPMLWVPLESSNIMNLYETVSPCNVAFDFIYIARINMPPFLWVNFFLWKMFVSDTLMLWYMNCCWVFSSLLFIFALHNFQLSSIRAKTTDGFDTKIYKPNPLSSYNWGMLYIFI